VADICQRCISTGTICFGKFIHFASILPFPFPQVGGFDQSSRFPAALPCGFLPNGIHLSIHFIDFSQIPPVYFSGITDNQGIYPKTPSPPPLVSKQIIFTELVSSFAGFSSSGVSPVIFPPIPVQNHASGFSSLSVMYIYSHIPHKKASRRSGRLCRLVI